MVPFLICRKTFLAHFAQIVKLINAPSPWTCSRTLFWEIRRKEKTKIQYRPGFEPTALLIPRHTLYHCAMSIGLRKTLQAIFLYLKGQRFLGYLGLVNVHVLTDCLSTTFYNSGASLATRSSRFPGAVATSATLPRPTSSSTSALQPPGGSLTRTEGEPPYSN